MQCWEEPQLKNFPLFEYRLNSGVVNGDVSKKYPVMYDGTKAGTWSGQKYMSVLWKVVIQNWRYSYHDIRTLVRQLEVPPEALPPSPPSCPACDLRRCRNQSAANKKRQNRSLINRVNGACLHVITARWLSPKLKIEIIVYPCVIVLP